MSSCRKFLSTLAFSSVGFVNKATTLQRTCWASEVCPRVLKCTQAIQSLSHSHVRSFCSKKEEADSGDTNHTEGATKVKSGQATLANKYEYFDEAKPLRILDSHELEVQGVWETVQEVEEEPRESERFHGISLQRGQHGIFDIEEFVDILRNENLKDICVIKIPESVQYCDYMVITTVKSGRQRAGIAEFLRQVAKRKKLPKDPFPIVEGTHKDSWIAMDLGNIVLHLFDQETRDQYDLETLWTVGSQYDDSRHSLQSEYEQFLSTIESESGIPVVPSVNRTTERVDHL